MDTRRQHRNLQLVSQGGTPSMSASLSMPKVLLAEDNAEMRRLLGKWLRDIGYEVVEFEDGTALQKAITDWQRDEDNPLDPDLIITDIRMPGRTGLEILAQLRASDRAIPVILITAFADLPTVQEAQRLGVTRVFSKPFDISELVATVRSLLDSTPGDSGVAAIPRSSLRSPRSFPEPSDG